MSHLILRSQMKTSSPQIPAAAPSMFPATFLPAAPAFGAAVLLALGAEVVVDDDELEDGGAEELEEEEEAAAELEVIEVVRVVSEAEDIEVAIASVAVTLVVIAVGVSKDVSVKITVGTEAVDAKLSVAAKTAPLVVEDALAAALEDASEAVAWAL